MSFTPSTKTLEAVPIKKQHNWVVAGIDYSSLCVDIVLLSAYDVSEPTAFRFPLKGKGSFDRTRQIGQLLPDRKASFWDDVVAIGIEEPAGKGIHYQTRVQGAILSMIPSEKLVWPWYPHEWKRLVGLPGNATKAEIVEHATPLLRALGRKWSVETVGQDCFDAFLIAAATRDSVS